MLIENKSSTFFELLNCEQDLDLRDNRGKKHRFSVVILGVLFALFRCRDGNLSSIHRALTNNHAQLCEALNIEFSPSVSRAQLPLILKKRMLKFFLIYFFYFLALN